MYQDVGNDQFNDVSYAIHRRTITYVLGTGSAPELT